jgi:hypothetical protein
MTATRNDTLLFVVPHDQLSQEIAAFLIDRQARGVSKRTPEFYCEQLSCFARHMETEGIREIESVTATHIRRYLLRLAEYRNPGGIHCAYRPLKTFHLWYESEAEPKDWSNPIRKVKVKTPNDAPLEPLSIEHLKGMLTTCERKTFAGERDAAILLALLDTGCRAAEFLALNAGDINLSSGSVRVLHGKGGKFRTVFNRCESTPAGAPLPAAAWHRQPYRTSMDDWPERAFDRLRLAADTSATSNEGGRQKTARHPLLPAGIRLAVPQERRGLRKSAAPLGSCQFGRHQGLLGPDRNRPTTGASERWAGGQSTVRWARIWMA